MDLELIKTALMVINMLGTFGIGVWLYLEKRNDKTNARIGRVEDDLGELRATQCALHSRQLARLEEGAEHGPTRHDLGQLHEKVNAVRDDVSTLRGRLEGIDTNVRMILARITEKGLS